MAQLVTFASPGDASPTWVPVDACTLPTVEQPVRIAEFDTLFAENLTSVDRPSPTRVLFVLTGDDSLADRAQGLADRETDCCSFFSFEITQISAGSVALQVAVPDTRADVLEALVQRAQDAQERAQGDAAEAETA